MYLVDKETFEKLPDDAKMEISESCQSVEDEQTIESIKEMVGGETMKYGEEGEYEDKVNEEGEINLKESDKNGIKSFDDAADRGNALIIGMSMKKKDDKVKKIPKKEGAEIEKIEADKVN